MIGTVYNGMSGLLAFSRGLNTISTNVSNMNTPGFKSSELQFMDIFYRAQYTPMENGDLAFSQTGNGVGTGSTTIHFTPGEIRSTGADLDAAIDGEGFFILQKDGDTFYTRVGQFEFDKDGYLVSKLNQARVMSLDASGNLQAINRNNVAAIPQVATTSISFSGILSTGTQNSSGNPIHTVSAVKVYDALGTERTLTVEFELTDITTLQWAVRVREGSNNIATGSVSYQVSGQPLAGSNTVNFSLTSSGGTVSDVVLTMGVPGDTTASTSSLFGTTSSLRTLDIDGHTAGSLVTLSFNDKGIMQLEYSNGEKEDGAQLALAIFTRLGELEQGERGTFIAHDMVPVLGYAGDGSIGKLVAKSVELSNVDLTQEFGNLIIVQRGYQASSQILTVTNEMLQQLMQMRGR